MGVGLRFDRLRGLLLVVVFVLVLVNGGAARAAATLSWSAPVGVDHRPPYGTLISLSAVSCPSRSLCVALGNTSGALGDSGDVVTSTNPAGGSGAWRVAHVDGMQRLTAVSCASVSFCVAADARGRILTSDHPTGGAAAWKAFALPAFQGKSYHRYVEDLSCPSRSLCVGVDDSGDVVTSTHPAGGASAWRVEHVVSNYFSSVSCASVSLCVAVSTGNGASFVVTSTHPSRGAAAWTVTRVPGVSGMSGIACPSASLCVAASVWGDIVTSRNPTGGGSAWSVAHVGNPTQLGRGGELVSCASISLCAVTSGQSIQNVLTSSDPGGGASAWTTNRIAPVVPGGANAVSGLSCPSDRFCVAADSAGDVITSSNATGGSAAWRLTKLGKGYNSLSQMTCPSLSLCVAVDNAGNVVTSTNPAGGAAAWKVTHVGGVGSLSCPSASLCVMYDSGRGSVITSTHPAGGASAWKIAHVENGTTGRSGVLCASPRLCVAFDGAGNVITSTNPDGGASAWRVAHVDTSSIPCGGNHPDVPCAVAGSLTAIACPSVSLCVAVDNNGYVLTSQNPTGGASAWTLTPVGIPSTSEGFNGLWVLSCPSVSLCAAGDFFGNVVASRYPTSGAPSDWNIAAVGGSLTDLSCPALSLCVGVVGRNVVASRNPTGGTDAWTVFPVEPSTAAIGGSTPPTLSHVTCPSASLCVAIDFYGNVLSSRNPAGGSRAWNRAQIDSNGLSAVSCKTVSLCIAIDGHGNIVIGSSPPTSAQLRAQLRKDLAPTGKAAKITAITTHRGYTLPFAAPIAGRLAISWYTVPNSGHHASAPVLIATGRSTTTHPGSLSAQIRLTTAGKRLLRDARHVKVTAKGAFTPTGKTTVVAIRTFTLTR